MTNQEILEIVYRKYKIRYNIKRMIKLSHNDDSYKDMEQIVYTILMTMDNKKLNHLYNTDGLKKWISTIIKNNRNYYRSEYNLTKIGDNQKLNDDIELYIFEHNYKLDWLDEELNKYDWENLNKDDLIMCANYGLLKFYLSSGSSMKTISKKFNCSASKINKMITDAKKNIKDSFETGYDDWYEKNVKI